MKSALLIFLFGATAACGVAARLEPLRQRQNTELCLPEPSANTNLLLGSAVKLLLQKDANLGFAPTFGFGGGKAEFSSVNLKTHTNATWHVKKVNAGPGLSKFTISYAGQTSANSRTFCMAGPLGSGIYGEGCGYNTDNETFEITCNSCNKYTDKLVSCSVRTSIKDEHGRGHCLAWRAQSGGALYVDGPQPGPYDCPQTIQIHKV